MYKLKKGDVVKCTDCDGDIPGLYLVLGEKYIIEEVEDASVWGRFPPRYRLKGVRGGFYSSARFTPVDTQQKRKELKAAIELVQSYKVATHPVSGMVWMDGDVKDRSVDDMVALLLPLESPQQKKLRELERQQLEIVAKMEQLRSEL